MEKWGEVGAGARAKNFVIGARALACSRQRRPPDTVMSIKLSQEVFRNLCGLKPALLARAAPSLYSFGIQKILCFSRSKFYFCQGVNENVC
jgi:hypothetical protein